MPTTRLSRSIPFWVLVAGSVVAIAGGAYLLITKLAVMASTLTDGSATGVEVYAGQTWAVVGGILVGAGLVGLALALTLAALRAVLAPRHRPEDTRVGRLVTCRHLADHLPAFLQHL